MIKATINQYMNEFYLNNTMSGIITKSLYQEMKDAGQGELEAHINTWKSLSKWEKFLSYIALPEWSEFFGHNYNLKASVASTVLNQRKRNLKI